MNPALPADDAPRFSPGSIVRARGREWIVLSGSTPDVLRVRPVTGSDEDATRLHLALEPEPVAPSTFPWPTAEQRASHDGALLLRDALRLSLRRGAGPFRCLGQLAVEPRAYQLVPLLMALKLDPVRLLIADDVGVGKTIEAGLITRELLDRGDVSRFTVLCPPHLVDQWVKELDRHFHLKAVALTASTAARIERDLPVSESPFTAFPYTVVSLDYIKADRRRAEFTRACPELVLVDEAHTCAASTGGRHQRHELLAELARSPDRHLILLTATPHSGDDVAFGRLLGLLNPDFAALPTAQGDDRERLRERLAAHLVQRQRGDILKLQGQDDQEAPLFPRRERVDLPYKLTGAWEAFFAAVLDYCAGVVAAAEGDTSRERLNFWGTLALLRCAASSPAAAALALRCRAGLAADDPGRDALMDRLFDGAEDTTADDDVEPPAGGADPALSALITQAEALAGQDDDPKLRALTERVTQLLNGGFHPVVFCRYIATAHYLARHLQARLPKATVIAVTGELPSDEREVRVAALGEAERRVLVATDCLSEGINLQARFSAVVHYDLSWNPTRHEQREGRVDRYGQPALVVRTVLMYGANNPVDGAVLEVILRKAASIRESLGVPVPLPDEGHALSQALLKAVLLRRRGAEPKREEPAQLPLALGLLPEVRAINTAWTTAAERATRFAQTRRVNPQDVLPDWQRAQRALGGQDTTRAFLTRALSRLSAAPTPTATGLRVSLQHLPSDLRERLDAEGLRGDQRLSFTTPPAEGHRAIHRSDPLVSVLAEALLARCLVAQDSSVDPAVLGRVGCWVSGAVTARTLIVLTRLRHRLTTTRGRRVTPSLVEEASALALQSGRVFAEGEEALALLDPLPLRDPPPPVRIRQGQQALVELQSLTAELHHLAQRRAEALARDHDRARESSRARGRVDVEALSPPDVVALYVLLPAVEGAP